MQRLPCGKKLKEIIKLKGYTVGVNVSVLFMLVLFLFLFFSTGHLSHCCMICSVSFIPACHLKCATWNGDTQ